MIIKSVSGKTIINTDDKTVRQTLEWCVQEGIDLSGADLRNARLSHASLDGMMAQGACLWGADLTGSDIGFADLQDADLRCTTLKDTCLAESDLSRADLQGAYFCGTMVEDARLDGAILSCPSFWDCDLHNVGSMRGLVYNHLGETKLVLFSLPVVLKGFSKQLVLLNGHCLWGSDLYEAGALPLDVHRSLFEAKVALEKTMRGDHSQAANKPDRKIHSGTRPF